MTIMLPPDAVQELVTAGRLPAAETADDWAVLDAFLAFVNEAFALRIGRHW